MCEGSFEGEVMPNDDAALARATVKENFQLLEPNDVMAYNLYALLIALTSSLQSDPEATPGSTRPN
jgi:hypothetical protein